MQVVPLSKALGAELVDFDITRPCTTAEVAELRQLFCEYHLLLLRGQDVTAEDQTRFVGYFGPLHLVRSTGAMETFVSNREDRMIGTGTTRLLWHNDGTYGEHPGIATCLWAQELESGTVPTMFTNAIRVLDGMPGALRSRIEPLHALHLKDTHVERTDQRWREEEIPADAVPGRFVSYVHPIVYQPPHLRPKTLLVNELQTSHVVDLPRDEGEALLQELFSLLYEKADLYNHAWKPDDVLIWDNLALQHCRPAEMGAPRRHLRRQSVDGWYTEDGVLDWRDTVVRYEAIQPETIAGTTT
jgi:taurine dioxygenase